MLALLGAWQPAAALDPQRALSQLHHTAWVSRDGAPADAWALAQTVDGALWLGTPTGLFHFDGVSFERFKAEDSGEVLAGNVSALLALPDGGLWVGMRYGGAYLVQRGRLARHGDAQGLPGGTLFGFARDGTGRIWAASTRGLARLEAGRWQRVGEAQGLAGRYFTCLLGDAQGRVWVAGPEGAWVLSAGDQRFARLPGVQAGLGFLTAAPDGSVWYSGEGQMQSLSAVLATPGQPAPGFGKPSQTGAALVDREGGLWFVNEGELGRLPAAARLGPPPGDAAALGLQRFGSAQGLSGDAARALLEDREGNLWVSTNGGLDRFRAPKFMSVDLPLLFGAAWMAGEGGSVWAGTPNAGLRHLSAAGRELRAYPQVGSDVIALHRAASGTYWVGTRSQLWHSDDPAGQGFTELPLPAQPPDSRVRAIASDHDGGLWVSLVRAGVFRYQGGRWTERGGLAGLPAEPAIALYGDSRGRFWFSYVGPKLALWENGRVRRFDEAQGPRVGLVQAMHGDGERTWLGGNNGLALWVGERFSAVVGLGDQRFEGISAIVQSGDGALWLNAAGGVFRLPAGELARAEAAASAGAVVPLVFEHFNHEDGLRGAATQAEPLPSALKGSDGRLWFSTSRDVQWIDPARIARNPRAPTVQLRALTAHGQRHAPAQGLVLPQGTTQLELDYTALSLAIPAKLHFRYWLDGVDADWHEAGARRRAFYTNLGPGDYHFRVSAANEDGVWSQQAAELRFTIAPAYYQTVWFRGLCLLAAAALLWAGYRMRMQQVAARARTAATARMQERERIARELHDTLLQSTQGLILSVQGIAEQTPGDDPARGRIDHLLLRADQALAEGRRRVQDLRSDDAAEVALPEALAALAREFDDAAGPVVRSRVAGSPRPLALGVQTELLRLAREALLNAARHAQAGLVELTLACEPEALRLSICDDGVGLDDHTLAAGAREGHWGLPGMRERARELGGELQLCRREGGGTEVRFSLPARAAYRLPPRRLSRFHRLLARWRRR